MFILLSLPEKDILTENFQIASNYLNIACIWICFDIIISLRKIKQMKKFEKIIKIMLPRYYKKPEDRPRSIPSGKTLFRLQVSCFCVRQAVQIF